MAFIEVNQLSKHYGDTVALENVSLTLEEGKTAAIIGSAFFLSQPPPSPGASAASMPAS